MGAQHLYFYGVMAGGTAPARMAGPGIAGAGVHRLNCGELDALVSWVSPEEAHLDVDAALAHEKVLASALEAGAVIPAAFGHLFRNEADLCDLLNASAQALKTSLAYIDGRVEVGLKALWTKESFLPDIETAELQELTRRARQPGADQSVAVAVGQLVEQLVDLRREQYVRAICGQLEPQAVAMKLNDPLAVRMAINAAFLVEAREAAAFLGQMEEVVRPYRDRLEFSITGPWPAHSFANIRL